jgi:hypothetical protein
MYEWPIRQLVLDFGSKPVIKRSFAVFVLWHVFAGNNGHVHHASPAGFAQMGRLLSTVPDPAVMHRQIARIYVKAHFPGIGVIIYKVFLFEEES